ncbi:MAG: hypothetical protein KDG89_04220 [Geminicoccaceae bacterium]|nr:hypothetical protein [Geminicoccaceae bacterium]
MDETVALFGQMRRSEALDILGRLAPTLAALGGSALAGEAVRAVRDAARWWP